MDNRFKIKQSVLIDCFVNTADLIIPDIVTTIGVGLFSKSHILDRFIRSALSSEANEFSEESLRTFIRKKFNNSIPLSLNFKKVTPKQLMSKFSLPEIDCLGVLSELTRVNTIHIPLSVKVIKDNAFADLSNLHTIFYEGSNSQWEQIDKTNNDFSSYTIVFSQRPPYIGNKNNKDELYENTLYVRGENSIVDKNTYFAYNKADEVNILSSVIEIRERAFFSSHIKTIKMENSVTKLGGYCFSHSDIERIELSDKITDIPMQAFSDCSNLTYVKFPKLLEKISNSAFAGCNTLNYIDTPTTLTYIGDYAFENCENIKYLALTKHLSYIGEGAFKGCNSLRYLLLFAPITTIHSSMCEDCINLETILIPETVKVIESSAFHNCKGKVIFAGTPEQWDKVRIGVDNDILLKGVEFYGRTNSRTFRGNTPL